MKRNLDTERNRSAALVACLRDQISGPNGYQLWQGICYKAFDTPKAFIDAAASCRKDVGTLAMPRDAETNTFLTSFYKSARESSHYYIGLHDQREEGVFEWVDGSALGTYNSWAPGEPDGFGDCVAYISHRNDKWSNFPCDRKFRFVCQAIPVSCPNGYQLWRGICYKAFDTPKVFIDAAVSCRKDGGTLAMPRDAETNTFLITLYRSVRESTVFFIGLKDERKEGVFEWVDGSTLGTYNSWAPGEPDGFGDCVAYNLYRNDKWNSFPCDYKCRFVCQAIPGASCKCATF
ncbi:macrophage mannose receptor 1-like [Branchiostoma lanceolatum]|uniref:macrophage mannose receptor 1-like n=1 Tax=Branchiostoma lanceolatum TaxID=7740 RepID=UPI0034535C7C